DGKIEFATPALPGWTHDGKRDDPRNPKDGPLPREWAKYKGLYLNGDTVVLSYSVRGVTVLEKLYGSLGYKELPAFQRTIQIDRSDREMELLVFEKSKHDIFKHLDTVEKQRAFATVQSGDFEIQAKADKAPTGCRFEL